MSEITLCIFKMNLPMKLEEQEVLEDSGSVLGQLVSGSLYSPGTEAAWYKDSYTDSLLWMFPNCK